MSRRSFKLVYMPIFAALLLGGPPVVNAQLTTEQYIPIGSSPGVSGRYSYIGEVVAVDRSNGTLTVQDESGRHTLRVTGQTRIWLDRSQSRRANLQGDYEDCAVGRRVEVMHGRDDQTIAEWIKVETQ